MASAADLELLCRVQWKLWGTLTFRSDKSSSIQERMWFHFVRLGSERFDFRRNGQSFFWVRRSELGELGARPHYHFLIGSSFIQRLAPIEQAWFLCGLWEGLSGGMARVTVYQPDASGALPYMLKGLNGGLAYETGKLANMASEVIWSDGVQRLIRGVLRVDQDFARHSLNAWTDAQASVGEAVITGG